MARNSKLYCDKLNCKPELDAGDLVHCYNCSSNYYFNCLGLKKTYMNMSKVTKEGWKCKENCTDRKTEINRNNEESDGDPIKDI